MKTWLLAMAFTFLAVPASAQMTPIWKWDCGAGGANYPSCNADSVDADGALFNRSYIGDVGPNGEPTVRIDHVGTVDTTAEYYHGKWDKTVAAVTQGACRYHRERIRFNATVDWQDEDEGRFGFKHIVQGQDGALDSNRFFWNWRSDLTVPGGTHEGNEIMLRVEKNVDGPPSRVDIHDFDHNSPQEWQHIQIRICSSSDDVTADGSIAIWLNNNTEGSPTITSSGGFIWDTNGWTRISLGFYGESLGTAHSASYDIAAYEYDDEFDPNWFTEGGEPEVGTKYRYRFRVEP